jgi:folate receptor
MKFSIIAVGALSAMSPVALMAYEESCTQFKNIYADGTELCEKMWDDSFMVVDDDEPGYTMWFFNHEINPNDDVTAELFGADAQPDKCHLQYFHKDVPSAEDDALTECHPWKKSSCCDSETVTSAEALNKAYGPGYEWYAINCFFPLGAI